MTLRRIHLDITRGKLDDMAFAGGLVGLLPVNLDGGIRQAASASAARASARPLCSAKLRSPASAGASPVRVTVPSQSSVIGPHAERDGSPIRFIVPGKVRAQPGGGADANRQHTACQRIERARMADALLAEDAPAAIDHVMGRHAAGLVHADYQRQPRFSSLHLAHTASCSAARTCSTASCILPCMREACRGNVTAAAEADRAMAETSVSSFARRLPRMQSSCWRKHAGDVDAGDGTQRVDDRLGIRFHSFETGEIRERKIADGEPFPLMELRARDRLRLQAAWRRACGSGIPLAKWMPDRRPPRPSAMRAACSGHRCFDTGSDRYR